MALYTRFINSSAVTSRAAEFTGFYNTATNWNKTANNGASNAVGLGIGTQTNLQAPPTAGWTLLDQFGIARTSVAGNQKSQVIGGAGYTTAPSISTLWSSGGVSGNASQSVQLIFSVTNPPNVVTNSGSVPDPAYPAPTVVGSAQMATLAAGWVDA
jgi:hypothetical protein